jgi:Uncharacterized protein conserved in bacteria (DUF2252)
VVEGARHLSPYLGKRMRALKLLGKPAFVRELMPQDLKIEIEQVTADRATSLAGFLAGLWERRTIGKWNEARACSGVATSGATAPKPRMAVEERRRSACGPRKGVPGALPQVRPSGGLASPHKERGGGQAALRLTLLSASLLSSASVFFSS